MRIQSRTCFSIRVFRIFIASFLLVFMNLSVVCSMPPENIDSLARERKKEIESWGNDFPEDPVEEEYNMLMRLREEKMQAAKENNSNDSVKKDSTTQKPPSPNTAMQKGESPLAIIPNFQILVYAVIILAFSLVISFILFLNKINHASTLQSRMKRELFDLKKENAALRNQYLRQGLSHKNKESNILVAHLLEKNKSMNSAIGQISELRQRGTEHIDEIIKKLQEKNQKEIWEGFEEILFCGHPNFYKNLSNKHPNLSSKEKRLCVLICLNMSTKEISSFTSQQIKAIEIARGRLRIKLGLKREVNFTSYLQEF